MLADEDMPILPAMPPKPWDFGQFARPAQRLAVEKIHAAWRQTEQRPQGMMGMSCIGTGKTVVTLTALATSPIEWKRALVIAPPNVADINWLDEPETWQHLQGKFQVASTVGKHAKTRKAILDDPQYNLVTMSCAPAIVKWFFETYPPGKVPFDVLVIDEVDKFKTRSSARFKTISRRIFEFRIRLTQTGSPADENLLELYTQAKLTQPDIWKGMTWTYFKNNWFRPQNRHNPYSKLVPDEGVPELIYSTLEPITYRVAREDMGDMPERSVVVEELDLPPKVRAQYKQLERDFLVEVGGDDKILVGSAAGLHTKLKQVCDGFIYDEVKAKRDLHSTKADRAKDILKQLDEAGKQVLVIYRFRPTPAMLGIPHVGGDVSQALRRQRIKQFQDGSIQALAIHPASAGHGLNLQLGGCHHMLLFGVDESRRLYNQATGRIDRKGQRHKVVEIRLVMRNTVDEDVYRSLETKGVNAKTVLDAMRARVGLGEK